ncbi:hypothetical protein Hypma_014598 [Hypsizygus marmoreus]|uniref:Uncharacterized protein n=1 Tax=Hypsizygus marmoreus TaxID=39966 RepID=A0A369JHA1_HYPMA|nr:hypothetical protein Hypma_014598 [Hypsizygus marmoreus]
MLALVGSARPVPMPGLDLTECLYVVAQSRDAVFFAFEWEILTGVSPLSVCNWSFASFLSLPADALNDQLLRLPELSLEADIVQRMMRLNRRSFVRSSQLPLLFLGLVWGVCWRHTGSEECTEGTT